MGQTNRAYDVITDVCKDSYFFSAQVHYDEQQQPFLSPVGHGTGGPENFSEVVGQWSADELKEAIRKGYIRFGFDDAPEALYTELEKRKSGKRRLKL